MSGPDEVELHVVALALRQACQEVLPIPRHELRGQLDDVQLLPCDTLGQPHRVQLRLGRHKHLGRRSHAKGRGVVSLRVRRGAICRCSGTVDRGCCWSVVGIPVRLGAPGGVGAWRRSGDLGDAVLVVGMVGVGGLQEVELGVALVVGDDAALELGPVLGDEGGCLLDDNADVGRRVDDADGARVGGYRRRGVRLRAGRGRRRRRLLLLVGVAAVALRRGEGQDGVAHGGGGGIRVSDR